MVIFRATRSIAAPSAQVWSILAEVHAWPEWLPTVSHVQPLDGPSLGLGRRYSLRQPKLAPAIWTVVELAPGRCFVWTSRGLGLQLRAEHLVEAGVDGNTELTLVFQASGILAPLVFALFGATTRRYLDLEAEALQMVAQARMT